jgi:hypothetical protein
MVLAGGLLGAPSLAEAKNRHYVEQKLTDLPSFIQGVYLDSVRVKELSPKAWRLTMFLSSAGGVMGKAEDFTVKGKDLKELRSMIRAELRSEQAQK